MAKLSSVSTKDVESSAASPRSKGSSAPAQEHTKEELLTFFRTPAPPGRSRESRIVLDKEGRFSQDGLPFEHAKLAEAMHRWITRHPDDGRFVLSNGFDWSYFTVDDAPFFVRQLRTSNPSGAAPTLLLSDGSEEPLVAEHCALGADGALYLQVKHAERGGPYWAKFTRHAQAALAPYLEEHDGRAALRIADVLHDVPSLTVV